MLNFYYVDMQIGEVVILDAKLHYYVITSATDQNFDDVTIMKVDSPFDWEKHKDKDISPLNDNEFFQRAMSRSYPNFHRKLIKTILE